MDNINNIVEEFPFQLDEFYLDLQEDGSKITILDKEKIAERPFPGLRPFNTSEFQLFKGRDGQAEELIKRLKKSYFLSVIGSSGTGKSSLVRAGLIPQLFGGYLHEAGNKWNIAICRPGKNPIENLAIALSSVKSHTKDKALIYNNYKEIEQLLSNSIYGILDVEEILNSDRQTKEKPNLLIIIDQFEELFRFDRKDLGKDNIENHFVNLLLKASLNPESSVYVIITMRSEFLGDCVKYRGLPEAINEGQYLVPQLSRGQLKEVIEGPVNLAGKKISPGLVELLINEIDENKLKENLDQLPILQHALMRTYQEAMKHGPDTEISYEHYKKIGEMEFALANHAEAKYKDLGEAGNDDNNPSKKQKIAKIIFQALTDASADQKGGRRPTELKKIYAIAQSLNATKKEVNEVIDNFRDIETSFIMPPINTVLYPNLMIDISHESLMRNWVKLNNWIMEEVRFGRLYKLLNERREFNELDTHEFLRGILLKELIDWRDNYSKNATWAGRYHQLPKIGNSDLLNEEIYNKNLDFLKRSELKNQEAIDAEKKKLQDEIEREHKEESRKKIIWFFAAASIFLICFGIWAYAERNNFNKQKKKAEEQSKLATASADSARIQKGIAEKNANEANSLKLIAEDQTALALKTSDSVRYYLMKVREQKDSALILKNRAVSQNEESRKQLVRNTLQREKFYSSNILDLDTKESIINSLFLKPLHNFPNIPFSEYIDVGLLNNIDTAVEVREQIIDAPIPGLRKAESLWQKTKNKNVQKILLDIFKNNIFYKQVVEPLSTDRFSSYELSSLVISKDASHFAYNQIDKIATGRYINDSLTIDDTDAPGNYYSSNASDNYYSSTKILALTYNDNNKILSFQDDGKIIESVNKKKKTITSIPSINSTNIIVGEFSPDGNYLVVAFRDGLVKIWNIPELISGKEEPQTDNSPQNKYITQITCSPDSKRMIKFFTTGKIEVWNLSNNKPTNFRSEMFAYAANFSPDGNYILAASAGNTIYFLDSLGKRKNYLLLSSEIEDYNKEDYSYSRIDYLSLSPDWKKIIVKQNEKVLVYQKTNADSIFRTGKNVMLRGNSNLSFRTLSGAQEITKILFLNKNSVITLNYLGYFNLWNIDENFDDLDEAFSSVQQITALTFNEKLDQGQLSFTQVITTTNKDNLRKAAVYYNSLAINNDDDDDPEKIENFNRAKSLYIKLAKLDSGIIKTAYRNNIMDQNNQLIAIERRKIKPSQHKLAELYKENTIIGEELLKMNLADSAQIKTLSSNYWNLSWNQLFDKNFEAVIKSAKRGFQLYSQNDGINTNLALGFLLTKRFTEADSVYKKYMGKKYTNNSLRFFTDAFLQDFKDLEEAGIFSSADPAINKKVLEIKQMLQLSKE